MNRTELAEAVASRTGLDKRQSEAAVEAVTGTIADEVKAGNRVSIFGFGSFEPKSRAARTARNPQTQQTVKVPASKSVGFKPASAFKEMLNSKGRAGAAKKSSGATKTAAAKKSTAATSKASSGRATASKSTASKSTASKSSATKTAKAAKKR